MSSEVRGARRPEVCRTYNFGKKGTSHGQYFSQAGQASLSTFLPSPTLAIAPRSELPHCTGSGGACACADAAAPVRSVSAGLSAQYLADIVLNDVAVDWPRQRLDYLAEKR